MTDGPRLRSSLHNPFVALRHRNFRIYSAGMAVSLIGTWMQNIAQPWLAYQLTGSALLLSLVGALQFTPVLLFSLFAGVAIDRFPKKTILLFTQAASLVITGGLALLVWTGDIRYWHILVASTALGLVNTLDMPARQSFAVELVGRDDLMNAIALNSTVFNLSRVIGPAIAGLVMATAGAAACFLLNSASFAAMLVALAFLRPMAAAAARLPTGRMRDGIRDGLRYIRKDRTLVDTFLYVAIVGTFAPNFNVLVPVFAQEVLRLQETGFGFLMSALGAGSLLGAIQVAAISRRGPSRAIQRLFPPAVGLLLFVTGLTGAFSWTSLALAGTGFFFVAFSTNANSTLQMRTEDSYRGRVMSVYSLIFAGSTPLGNLFAGAFAERFGARAGFYACGAAVLALLVPMGVRRWKGRRAAS